MIENSWIIWKIDEKLQICVQIVTVVLMMENSWECRKYLGNWRKIRGQLGKVVGNLWKIARKFRETGEKL